MPDSSAAVFARLNNARPPSPVDATALLDTAVVLGGSVAGLLAARVLSDHARTVIVVEVDNPGDSTEPRPGVPQGTQIHVLLPRRSDPAGAVVSRLHPGGVSSRR